MSTGSGHRAGVALIVGVGKYRSSQLQRLPYAARDARALARVLADPDVCGLPAEQVALLTDGDARRDRIVQHLSKWLPERSRGVEIALIYFACHGMQRKIGREEEGYLLPNDADPDDVVTRGVAMSEVAHLMDQVGARAVVVILDCCHAGHVLAREGAISRSVPRDVAIKPAIFEKLSGRNRFLIASCDEGQKSIESVELKHGLFTYHLLRGIRGTADRDGDGKVGIAELFNYVSAAVARDARERFQSEQQPWVKGTWTDDVFLSAPRRATRPPTQTAALEQIWRDLGPDAAVAQLEQKLREESEPGLRRLLSFLRTKMDPAAIPLLFHCLAHRSEPIRKRAHNLVRAYGWEAIAAASAQVARQADSAHAQERVGFLLEGLAAIEANSDVVRLLDDLVMNLSGGLRTRAILLLDRKHLSLDLERIKTLFDSRHSPYRIEKVLGQGVFTAAYLARHEFTGVPVVVRVLRAKFVDDHSVRIQFLEVGKQSFRYVHPGFVHTRDVQANAENRIYYTVRDYVEGVTLQDVLAKGKEFEPLQVLEILRQTLEALTPVHERGACHCGIKPSNVFLSDSERVRVVLGDPSLFLAHFDMERLCYDYRYAAPEMFRGGVTPGPQADFYSLGCLGYELLSGAPPFISDNAFDLGVKHVNDPIPALTRRGGPLGSALDGFFNRLLAKLPSGRFRDISEAVDALDAARDRLRAPSESGSRPITLLGRHSLGEFDPLHSVLVLTGSRGAMPPAPDHTWTPAPDLPESTPREVSDTALESALDTGTAQLQEPRALPSGGDKGAPPKMVAGEVIFGKYRLIERIGEGGMGTVWRVRHLDLETDRALKVIRPEIAQHTQGWTRFQSEARLMERINHPHVVAIYDFARTQRFAYIEMEFLQGRSLADLLNEQGSQPVPLEQVVQILDQLCSVLEAAHSHIDKSTGRPAPIILRDVKPSNLMLVEREGRSSPVYLKVLDFGIAKMVEDQAGPELTAVGAMIGTPSYMSPEQISGPSSGEGARHEIDGRSDLYSTGVVLYQLLTGVLPFSGSKMEVLAGHISESPRPMNEANPKANVPRAVERVVRKCLEKDPANRPQSARELAEMFHAAMDLATKPGRMSRTSAGLLGWLRNRFRRP
jgi:serine/threonine protein kinase